MNLEGQEQEKPNLQLNTFITSSHLLWVKLLIDSVEPNSVNQDSKI